MILKPPVTRSNFACACLLLTLPLHAQDAWSRSDTIRETVVASVATADWLQTLNIQDHPGYCELNPLLGSHPSRGQVNAYFAASIGLHWLIAYLLPERFRAPFQYASIGWEVAIVAHNYKVGLSITF